MSGSGNEEHLGSWARVDRELSPGSSQFVLPSEPEARKPTRVMSPNPNDGILTEIIAPCLTCGNEAHEPVVCTGCGSYGHTPCLNIEYFKGYPWCITCFAKVAQGYMEMTGENVRDQWVRTFLEQSNLWKQTAKEGIAALAAQAVTDSAPPPTDGAGSPDAGTEVSAERNLLGVSYSPQRGWA